MLRWHMRSRCQSHRSRGSRGTAHSRLFRFDVLESRLLLSGVPSAEYVLESISWDQDHDKEHDEQEHEDEAEEREHLAYHMSYFGSAIFVSEAREDDEDEFEREDEHGSEYGDEDERKSQEHAVDWILAGDDDDWQDDDFHWEPEEQEYIFVMPADYLIRNTYAPVIASPVTPVVDLEPTPDPRVDSNRTGEELPEGEAGSDAADTGTTKLDVGEQTAKTEQQSAADEEVEPAATQGNGDEQLQSDELRESSTVAEVDDAESVEDSVELSDTQDRSVSAEQQDRSDQELVLSEAVSTDTLERGDDRDSLAPEARDPVGVDQAVASVTIERPTFCEDLDPNAGGFRGLVRHVNRRLVAVSTGSVSHWRLQDSIPHDLTRLEQALRALLSDRSDMGRHLADWLVDPVVLRWMLVFSGALCTLEVFRRKAGVSAPDGEPSDDELLTTGCHVVSMSRYPEVLGPMPETKR